MRLHVLCEPSEDLPGIWVAHCLDNDVVTQGESFEHAMEMIREAVHLALLSDIEDRITEPRKAAPPEDWARFNEPTPPIRTAVIDVAFPGQ